MDFGEVLAAAGFGTFFLAVIAVGYWRGDGDARTVGRYIVTMLLLLAFFGVLMDMFHTILWQKKVIGIDRAVGLIEDGGEMLVMSVITWFVFRLRLTSDPTIFLQGRRSVDRL